MEYQDLKVKIEHKVGELAKLIEKFCVLENKEYISTYKSKLWRIHELLEDLD